jgi:hypothetical protein
MLQLRSILQPSDVLLLSIVVEKIETTPRKRPSLVGLALVSHAASGSVFPHSRRKRAAERGVKMGWAKKRSGGE